MSVMSRARSLLIHCGQTSAESFVSIESMYSHCKFESVRIPKSPSLVKRPSGRTPLKPPLLYYCPFEESSSSLEKMEERFVVLCPAKRELPQSNHEKNRPAKLIADRLRSALNSRTSCSVRSFKKQMVSTRAGPFSAETRCPQLTGVIS
jgi:hypothetical protein